MHRRNVFFYIAIVRCTIKIVCTMVIVGKNVNRSGIQKETKKAQFVICIVPIRLSLGMINNLGRVDKPPLSNQTSSSPSIRKYKSIDGSRC